MSRRGKQFLSHWLTTVWNWHSPNYWPLLSTVALRVQGTSWSCAYGSWMYNYLCNQCLSPLTLRVWILLRLGVLDTTLCDKVCQWVAVGRYFLRYSVSATNKTDRYWYRWNIAENGAKHHKPKPMFNKKWRNCCQRFVSNKK